MIRRVSQQICLDCFVAIPLSILEPSHWAVLLVADHGWGRSSAVVGPELLMFPYVVGNFFSFERARSLPSFSACKYD